MEWLVAVVRGNREVSVAAELISGDGELNESGLEDFIKSVKLQESSSPYSVVAIMGPRNSGKSTLLNQLFGTGFTERNPSIPSAAGMGMATTRGVWIAKAQKEPFTLVLDLEGTDGRDRGLDGTTFEKQSALFATQVAHTLLINMWYHDFGREHASNRPLLRTIFEVVVTTPLFRPRRTTLFFIVRDMCSSDESLETHVRDDVQKIWDEVQKSEGRKDTPLSDLFNVEFFALSNYREKKKEFEKEVNRLRQQIINSIPHGGDRQRVVPASRFCLNTKDVWTAIKQINNLDLPAYKVMVATTRCEEIVKEKVALFASNQEWVEVKEAAETGVVSGLGVRIRSILSTYLSEYETESLYLEENVRKEKRQYLESEVLRLVHGTYIKSLGHLRSEQFQSFKAQLEATLLCEGAGFAASARNCKHSCVLGFDRRCSDDVVGWDIIASEKRGELLRDIETHIRVVCAERLQQAVDKCRERLSPKLTRRLRQLFTSCDEDFTWGGVKRVLRCESDAAASDLCSAFVGFELDPTTVEQRVNDIKLYARNLVENTFREETADTGSVLELMKQWYILSSAMAVDKVAAYRECLKNLAMMAVIRLDDEGDDNVESVLVSAFLAADAGGVQVSLASERWDGVPGEVTLISPYQCKDIWEKIVKDVEHKLSAVEIIKETNNLSVDVEGKQLENCRSTVLISGDGEFNEAGVEDFINSVKLHECGVSYAVVAIMGPQSSEPTFEKKTALFALAFADVVLINMWCTDIGRDQAANRPLLKTIFEVMLRLFSPSKTTLLFVIRDKAKMTPFQALDTKLREDVQKIWEITPKPQAFKATALSEFFKVEVVALSNYEHQEVQFKEEVAQLRNRFTNSISPGEIAGDRQRVVPASGFYLSAKNIWKTIKINKDLDLPTQKILVSSVRCDEIAKEKLGLFASDQKLISILQKTESTFVSDFGATISSILETYLSIYDSESEYYDEKVRNEKRDYLELEALKLVHPGYINTLAHLRSEAFEKFKTELEALSKEGKSVGTFQESCLLEFEGRCSKAAVKQAKWDDASTALKDLVHDVQNHTLLFVTEKLPLVVDQCREKLSSTLGEQLNTLIVTGGGKELAWDRVRSLLRKESDAAVSAFGSRVAAFDLDEETLRQKARDIKQYATNLVETKFKDASQGVPGLMTQRFMTALQEKEAKDGAYVKCLKLLSTLAVIRLDEKHHDDGVENLLHSALLGADAYLIDSTTWEQVPPEMTLIKPAQCKDIWTEFVKTMDSSLGKEKEAEKYWVDKQSNCNYFMIFAQSLWITWWDDKRYWNRPLLKESSNVYLVVAELLEVCWLEVRGRFEIGNLSPGRLYEVVFVVLLKDSAQGWEVPVNLRLTLPDGTTQEHTEVLKEKPRGRWIEIPAGEIKSSAKKTGEMEFSLFECNGGWKRGLLIKGVKIQPKA